MQFARDRNVELADEFVGIYVNKQALDYGPKGREATDRLLDEGVALGMIPKVMLSEFVE